MKGEMMNVETLSRPELLTLLSVLEGELEAQDVVIHALRAQHRDSFVQERYGQYDLSDPFLALQRDSETMEGWTDGEQAPGGGETHARAGRGSAVGPNPLAVLKLVMAHCKRMQERMMGQLAAAESRHRRVIADLEEERRGHARDAAQGDDVTFMLEKEREKLLQQLELERAAVRRLEKEQRRAAGQAEESLSHQRQLSSALTQELQRASSQALEEAERVAQLRQRLQEESGAAEALRGALEGERGRAAQLEARAERQLAELDTEREQMRVRIRREEERSRELEREVEELRRRLGEGGWEREKEEEKEEEVKGSPPSKTVVAPASLTSGQMEPDGKGIVTPKTPAVSKVNGHHTPREAEPPEESSGAENGVDNVGGAGPHSPLHTHPQSHPQSHPHPNLSPSSTASSSLSSSPVSSPVLAKRLGSPGFHQSSYQAGVNQRFHAARHKFQSQAELETQPLSPRDLSPTTTPVPPPPENTAAKQLARNTVTQVLSRFTSQQAGAKLPPLNSSPFGTDYRSLAASPTGSGGKSSPGPLSPGIRSPLTPRSHPPPIPPKKPGMSPSPGSPGPPARASLFPELTGGCGLSNGQEGAKEQDMVLSSSS
ncbi:CTTNBP2 N-terminal-like protein [Osmerus mordax]|uniref:CTTNBP2 N-terminal-like protein n=1 Tax=Osmerus mordax TaxID=8014 RepID=UPI00350F2047